METTFPRLLLQHAAAAAARRRRCARRNTASGRRTAGPRWRSWCEQIACGLHQAGLRRGEHMVVIGANRPRLYATMLAAQSLGAIPMPLYQDAVAAECVFPINNADVRFAFAEDQEQVDKLLEIREPVPAAARASTTTTRAACATTASPACTSLDALIAAGRRVRAARTRRFFAAEVEQGAARRRRRDVLHLGHHRQRRRAWCTPTARLLDRAPGRRASSTSSRTARKCWPTCRRRGSARTSSATRSGWPAATSSIAPSRRARSTIDLKEIGPTYYFAPPRIFEGLLTTRDDPHGGRGLDQAHDVPSLHGRRAARRPGADGRQAGRRARPAAVRASATCWSTGRCATTSASRACASPTPPARRSAPTCSPSTAPSAST